MNSPRTSTSDPIRVDYVPVSATCLPGRIGMTFAPGKKARGIAAEWSRDLHADLARLREVHRTRVLVSLVTDDELASLGIAELPRAAAEMRFVVLRHPIPDGGVPEVRKLAALAREIITAMREGGNVVVHCRGGLGRAGTVTAAVLVSLGHPPEQAMSLVRAARVGAIENATQEQILRDLKRAAEPATVRAVEPNVSRFQGAMLGAALADLGSGEGARNHGAVLVASAQGLIRARHRLLDRGMSCVDEAVHQALRRAFVAPSIAVGVAFGLARSFEGPVMETIRNIFTRSGFDVRDAHGAIALATHVRASMFPGEQLGPIPVGLANAFRDVEPIKEWSADVADRAKVLLENARAAGRADACVVGAMIGAVHGMDALSRVDTSTLTGRESLLRVAGDLWAAMIVGTELDFETYPPS